MDDFETIKVLVLPSGRVNRKNAARIFGRTTKTLAEWKCKGIGPRVYKVGGRALYDPDECLAMARGEKPLKP